MEFLEKPIDSEVLLETIQRALALDARRRAERDEHSVVRERIERLTPRELEVLGLVVDGLSSKQIAARLWVSSKTVEAHRATIMKKMEAAGVAQLVRMVVSAKRDADDWDDLRHCGSSNHLVTKTKSRGMTDVGYLPVQGCDPTKASDRNRVRT
jgi:DNA-binding CsgD family transcriptional regulator